MTKLYDVVDRDGLEDAGTRGHVCRRIHPTEPLAILNYTAACMYEAGAWTPVTKACRGIIYHTDTLDVVARPFRKFFNYGQREAPPLDLNAHATVTDKLDGSLGILYRTPGGLAIATRGAFESEQAIHATRRFHELYAEFVPREGLTYLFEIVYPDNRIVLDYGDQDDLILLGAVSIATGESVSPYAPETAHWTGPRADLFEYRTLADALAATPRENAEGLVVHLLDTDERVKLKQEDYVRLHRIVCGLNERTVWEHMMAGNPLADLLDPLPDEFHEWVTDIATRMQIRVDDAEVELISAFGAIMDKLPEGAPRKDFAMLAKDHPDAWALFSLHDGKAIRPRLWKAERPVRPRGPNGLAFSEDTA